MLEFKAPECTVNGEKIYKGINMDKMIKIAEIVGEDSVLLALIHAYLSTSYVAHQAAMIKRSYFHLWLAVPGTTAFVSLSELPANFKTAS